VQIVNTFTKINVTVEGLMFHASYPIGSMDKSNDVGPDDIVEVD
jgi:hypothetical protein